MLKRTLLIGILAVAAITFAAQRAPRLVIGLGTIGEGATAQWVNTNPNGKGKDLGHQAVELCKNVPTSENEAAGADISGVFGTPTTSLTGLAFTAVEPITSTGSPRWNIYFGPNDGDINNLTGVAFLGQTALQGQTVTYNEAQIQAALTAAGAQPGDVLKYLQIIQDEQGCSTISNITVVIGNQATIFSGKGKGTKGKRFLMQTN